MLKKIFLLFILFFPVASLAASPTCHELSSGNYCKYTGKVQNIYINTGNLILIYFDSNMDIAHANSLGMSIATGNAAAFRVSDNPEFAKLFYSTALAAQASGRDVTIQMRGNIGAYPKFDRIWLAAP